MIEHGPIGPRDVLLVVDVQNDFCSGGKLAVPGGEEVVPALNRLATQFEHVVLTQDWHPAGHSSFRQELNIAQAELILRKGYHREIDSYSAFYENDHNTHTGLAGYLRERGLERVFIAGLAFDFCVRFSAEDAKREGFSVVVVEDASRGIDVNGSILATRQALARLGISCIKASA
jgi:nicotinamidase/pyrazinamidase